MIGTSSRSSCFSDMVPSSTNRLELGRDRSQPRGGSNAAREDDTVHLEFMPAGGQRAHHRPREGRRQGFERRVRAERFQRRASR